MSRCYMRYDVSLSHHLQALLKKLRNINALEVGICYSLFVFSLVVRFVFNAWVLPRYDITKYISDQGYYWETYLDAEDYYQNYLYAFRYQNWDLYSIQPWPLSGYVYGPIFAYILVFFSYIVQMFHPGYSRMEISWEAVTLAPKVLDSITAVLVYKIIKYVLKEQNEKNSNNDYKLKKGTPITIYLFAILSSIFFTCMPVVLFYNNVMYLNSYGFTFFTVLSLYFLVKENHTLSAAFLSIALLTKITVLFLIPLWIIYVFRNNWEEGLKYLGVFITTWFIFSLPWIILHPYRYLYQQLWPGSTFNTRFSIDNDWIFWSTTPFHAFLYWKLDGLALIYYQLNNRYIPLLAFNLICYLSMLLLAPHFKEKKEMLLSYTAMFTIGMHIFLSRGNYKYYDAFFIPFIIIALTSYSYQFKNKYVGIGVLFSLICWVFIVNVWIIVKIKWLHMFYVFLLFMTMILTFDKKTHLGLYTIENYVQTLNYLKKFLTETYKFMQAKNLRFYVSSFLPFDNQNKRDK
ncbi:MAG: hypothetical protein ACTSYD_05015 [Candidatus Heimdallarchaeaceae archaeon]